MISTKEMMDSQEKGQPHKEIRLWKRENYLARIDVEEGKLINKLDHDKERTT